MTDSVGYGICGDEYTLCTYRELFYTEFEILYKRLSWPPVQDLHRIFRLFIESENPLCGIET